MDKTIKNLKKEKIWFDYYISEYNNPIALL